MLLILQLEMITKEFNVASNANVHNENWTKIALQNHLKL